MFPRDFTNSVLNWDVIKIILEFRDSFLIPLDLTKLKVTGRPFIIFKPPIVQLVPVPFFEFWGEQLFLP